MASSTADGDEESPEQEIHLVKEDDWWVVTDVETGVTTQGESRMAALENLDEAVALYRGEGGDKVPSWDEEKELLRDIGIDPDEVKQAREESDTLPDFMQ